MATDKKKTTALRGGSRILAQNVIEIIHKNIAAMSVATTKYLPAWNNIQQGESQPINQHNAKLFVYTHDEDLLTIAFTRREKAMDRIDITSLTEKMDMNTECNAYPL